MARAVSSPCLPVVGLLGPTPPETGSRGSGVMIALPTSDFEFGMCERSERAGENEDRQKPSSRHGAFSRSSLVNSGGVPPPVS